MSSVQKGRAAHSRRNGKTKTYLGIAGNKGFGAAVLDLALADSR
jgi:aspartate aminotransferase